MPLVKDGNSIRIQRTFKTQKTFSFEYKQRSIREKCKFNKNLDLLYSHAIIITPQKTNATCITKFYQSKFVCGVAITLRCLPPILSQALLAFYSGTL